MDILEEEKFNYEGLSINKIYSFSSWGLRYLWGLLSRLLG